MRITSKSCFQTLPLNNGRIAAGTVTKPRAFMGHLPTRPEDTAKPARGTSPWLPHSLLSQPCFQTAPGHLSIRRPFSLLRCPEVGPDQMLVLKAWRREGREEEARPTQPFQEWQVLSLTAYSAVREVMLFPKRGADKHMRAPAPHVHRRLPSTASKLSSRNGEAHLATRR